MRTAPWHASRFEPVIMFDNWPRSGYLFLTILLPVLIAVTATGSRAAQTRWRFEAPSIYSFDSARIEMTGSKVRLKKSSNWFDFDWKYRQKITIDHNQINSTLTDFPIYLDLSDMSSGFFSNLNTDGSDIVVTGADKETKLDRELVSVDTTDNKGELWFRAPKLPSNADTEFYIYYGNPDAAQVNDTTTWDSQYIWVHHLDAQPVAVDALETPAAGVVVNESMDDSEGDWVNFYGSDPFTDTQIQMAMDRDRIGDSDRSTTTEPVGYWIFSQTTLIKDDAGNVIGEVDNVSSVDTTWTTVNFSHSYSDPIVVTTYELTDASNPPTIVRVKEVAPDTFKVKLQNPGARNDPTPGRVHFIAMETGQYTLPDGSNVTAGHHEEEGVNSSSNWSKDQTTQVSDNVNVRYPTVLGQVMSYNDTRWQTFWSFDGRDRWRPPRWGRLYVGRHVGEDDADQRYPEEIGWIVLASPGKGKTNGVKYWTEQGLDKINGVDNNPPYFYNLLDGPDRLFLDSTGNDNDGGQRHDLSSVSNTPVGNGIDFGTNGYIPLHHYFTTRNDLPEMTSSVWMKSGGGNYLTCYDRSEFYRHTTTTFNTKSTDNGDIHDQNLGVNSEDNSWHLNTTVYDGNDKIMYLDADEKSRAIGAHGGEDIGDPTTRYGFIGAFVEAGQFDGNASPSYSGRMDEARLSKTARSQAWLEATYTNHNSPATFYTIGSQEEFQYVSSDPAVVNNEGVAYDNLNSFGEIVGDNHSGTITYQISNSGDTWFYWNGSRWVEAFPDQRNSAPTVENNISNLTTDVGTGTFYFQAFLESSGSEQVELDQIDLGFTPRSSTVIGDPNNTGLNVTGWQQPTDAYVSDDAYAFTSSAGTSQDYTGYGFSLADTANIRTVEVGVEQWSDGSSCNMKTNVEVSIDSGGSFKSAPTSTKLCSDDDNPEFLDVTHLYSWSPADLSDSNLLVKISADKVAGGSTDTLKVDYLPVRVITNEPFISIDTPPSNHDTNVASPTIQGTAFNADTGDSVLLEVDGVTVDTVAVNADSSWTATANLNGHGDRVAARLLESGPASTFLAEDTITVNYDAVAPELSINEPDNQLDTSLTSITVAGTTGQSAKTGDTIFVWSIEAGGTTSVSVKSDSNWSATGVSLSANDTNHVHARIEDRFTNVRDDAIVVRSDDVAPSLPNLLSPVSNSGTDATNVKFSWSGASDSVSGIEDYRIQISNSTDFSPIIDQRWTTSSPTTFELSEGQYFWRIKVRDQAGNVSSYTSSDSFTVDRSPPLKPALQKPVDAGETNGQPVTFDWSDAEDTGTGIKNYSIEIATDTGFSTIVSRGTPNVSDTSAAMATGTYFWHVRARDELNKTSSFTNTDTFFVDRTAPGLDTTPLTVTDQGETLSLSGLDGSGSLNDGIEHTVRVRANGADTVLLYYRKDGSPADTTDTPVAFTRAKSDTWECGISSSAFYQGDTLNFILEATDIATNQAFADSSNTGFEYKIQGVSGDSPPTVDLVAPNWNNEIARTVSGTYVLSDLNNDPGTVSVEVSDDSGLTWDTIATITGEVNDISSSRKGDTHTFSWDSLTDLGTSYDTRYKLRLRAIAAGDTSSWDTSGAFAVDNQPPKKPQLLTPADGSATSATNVPFDWENIADTPPGNLQDFYFQVTTDSTFSSIIKQGFTTSSETTVYLLDDVYHWRVFARDVHGNTSAYTTSDSFSLDGSPPEIPSLYDPNDREQNNNSPQYFNWDNVNDPGPSSLDHYHIQVQNSSTNNNVVDSDVINSDTSIEVAESTYDWRVRAEDAAGNQSSYSDWDRVNIDFTSPDLDTSTLHVTNTQDTIGLEKLDGSGSLEDGINQQIRINASDVEWIESWRGNGSMQFHYRTDGVAASTSDPSLSMSLVSGDTYEATLESRNFSQGDTINFVVRGEDPAGNVIVADSQGTGLEYQIEGELRPTVNLLYPDTDARVSNNVSGTYVLYDTNTNLDTVTAEVSDDSGASWDTPATLTDGVGGVTNDPDGDTHFYTWNSLTDIGDTWMDTVKIRMRATNGDLLSPWDTSGVFMVDNVKPIKPSLISPAPEAVINDDPVGFDWTSVTDTPTGELDGYRFEIATSSSFSSLADTTFTASSSASFSLASDTYYWRVYAKDNAGNTSGFTSTDTFVLDTRPPRDPELLKPDDNSETNVQPVPLDWYDVKDPGPASFNGYHWQLDDNADFSSPLFDRDQMAGDTTVNLSEGTYHWRVYSRDNAGNTSTYTPADSFVVDRTPPAIDSGSVKVSDFSDTLTRSTLDGSHSLDDGVEHLIEIGVGGADTVILYYNIQGIPADRSDTPVELSQRTTDRWGEGISNLTFSEGDTINFMLWAQDRATNTDTEDSGTQGFEYRVQGKAGNSPPYVNLVSPDTGAAVQDQVPGTYVLTDINNDPGTITVEVSDNSGVTWDTKATVDGETSGVSSSSTGETHTFFWDSLTDIGSRVDTQVRLRVKAFDGISTGPYDTSGVFTVDNVIPPRVTDLGSTASVTTPDTGVFLRWNNVSSDVFKYRVYRTHNSTDTTGASVHDSVTPDPDTVYYQDTHVTSGDSYFYYVTAVDTAGNESDSSPETTTPHVTIEKVYNAGGQFRPGDTIIYTLNYTNDGFGPTGDIVVEDALPKNTYLATEADTLSGPPTTIQYKVNGSYQTSYDSEAMSVRWTIDTKTQPRSSGVTGQARMKILIE